MKPVCFRSHRNRLNGKEEEKQMELQYKDCKVKNEALRFNADIRKKQREYYMWQKEHCTCKKKTQREHLTTDKTFV